MNISKQIEELERKANQGEFYKQRYDELLKAVQVALESLNKLATYPKMASSRKSKDEANTAYITIAKRIYADMQLDDTMQVDSDKIKGYLIKDNMPSFSSYVSTVRAILLTMKGVHQRTEGHKIFLFYHSPKEE